MTHYGYNARTNPAPDKLGPIYPCDEPCCAGVGPGGRTTNVSWDEKGMLDRRVMNLANPPAPASLPADHDRFKQGIYTTNSVGDYD